ncbi:hypothetical protein HY382_01185 [Candidatus Curtissbacteria bacterium]|nr:hypothetical protein [Candidatus Curtissbacteria bacterium]
MKNQKQDTTLSSIKQGLNLTGTFLENKVFVILDQDPTIVTRREEPYSGHTSESFEGTIDVFASSVVQKNVAVCFCIECKRANPEQKHWVFEKRVNDTEPLYYPFDYLYEDIHKLNYEKNIFFPSLGYNGMKFFDKGIQVFEFKEVDGQLSRNQVEKAYNALLQANEAVSSFIEEPYRIRDLLKESKLPDILFLPIVVTTANLWVQDYKPENVDLKTGTVAESNINLEQKDWVHFEFPLPYSLRTRHVLGVGPVKRPTFIVNSEKISEFFPKLLADCRKYISGPMG